MNKLIYILVILISTYGCSGKIKAKPVCVIGAGIAGLTSARYLKDMGIDFTVLEATRYVGGTWRYDPRIGTDEYGLPLHTSMYKRLRTNLPKPTMELRGFPLPKHLPSFPGWEDYYTYLQDYAQHFGLLKYIKFLHNVILVKRLGDNWSVKYQNVLTKEIFEDQFEYVIVGNGHYSKPNMPNIRNENLFQGRIIHSHDYRVSDVFSNRRVLIVGAGPSGMDIALDVAEVSDVLVHSHHSPVNFKTPFPSNYVKKPDVKEFNETGATFVDGTYVEVDDVIYCTGFHFDYPFLDESSGLVLKPHSVIPLYQYMVNINQPTMIIMGLVIRACLVIALDAQARYAAALIKGNFTLPSRDNMLEAWQKKVDANNAKSLPLSFMHILAEKEDQYYADLTEEAGIERVPPVMYEIRVADMTAKIENLYTYRNYEYTVIDDYSFKKEIEKRPNNGSLNL